MQGLYMVSRDGKLFYWVIFKLPTSWEQCVIAYMFAEWTFTSFPKARNLQHFVDFIQYFVDFTFITWLLDQNWKGFRQPSENFNLPDVFSSVY